MKKNFMLTLPFTPKHLLTVCTLTFLLTGKLDAQITLEFQGGEPGDTWGYTSTGADAVAQAQTALSANIVTGTRSIVVGGNTGGGNCFDVGTGNGPNAARTFTFNSVNISTSNNSTRTLTFNWGNRHPICNGTGWDSGENLVFTAYHDGIAQPSVTLCTGSGNLTRDIHAFQHTHSIPPCVNNFYFRVSITTNRRDELLFLDNVKLTTPVLNSPVAQPSAITGDVLVCQGTNETYNVVQESGILYTWSGLPAGAVFTTTNGTNASYTMNVNWGTAVPGTYTLTVTPSDLCGSITGTPQTINVTIAPPTSAAITVAGPLGFCPGDSVILSANTATGISWTGGSTDSSITVYTGGTYTLTVTGVCGTATASETVTVHPATVANITASGPTTFCPGGSVTLTSGASTGNSWSTSATTPSIMVDTTGTYILTVTGICGADTDTINVVLSPVPTATITASGPTTFCAGGSVTLTSSSATGNSWSTTETTPSINITTSGVYTLTVTSVCGTATASETITVNPLTTAGITSSGPTTFCAGGSVTLTSSSATGNIWSTSETTPSITVNTAGVYTLTVTGICGTATASETITVNPLPTASITSTVTSLCPGDSVLLTATGIGTTYLWSNGQTTNAIYGFAPGTYTVTAFNGCGNAVSSPVTLSLLPDPVAVISGAGVLCAGNTLTLSASGGASYLWSTTETTGNIDISVPGTYVLTALNGCGTDTAVVHIPLDDLHADFTTATPNGTAPLPVDFTNLSTGSITGYVWDFGNGNNSIDINPSTVYTEGGTYMVTLTATSVNGCNDTHTLAIEVEENPSLLLIPNVFSPNGDHVNDEFRVNGEFLENFQATIFNRWGEAVMQWNDMKAGWDGKDKNGNPVTAGTYFYVITATGNDSKTYSKNGSLTLVR